MSKARLINMLLSAGFVLTWSSGFIGAILVGDNNPFQILFLRFLVVIVLLLPVIIIFKNNLLSILRSFNKIKFIVITALFGQFIYLVCVFYAIKLGLQAGIVALIAALQPVATALLSGSLLKEKLILRQWIGLCIGLFGTCFVIIGGTLINQGDPLPLWIYLLPFISMLSLTASTIYQKKNVKIEIKLPPLMFIQAIINVLAFSIICLFQTSLGDWSGFDNWGAVLWLALFSTLGAYGLLAIMLRRGELNKTASLIYLEPPTTMILAYFWFGQQLNIYEITGSAIALSGVIMVIYRRA
ncbi:DMT family transporter [Serratia fonticola]|uniref:DMT family transporter n=1 Tax=Serratia fonticola TaxID=47917 RepID=A0AAJ1Y9Y0_SERFO|nr:DMT family transporter [Serratia fonticola]MDQ9125757.1 DMT family transporter [Serratia fonticola]